MKDSQFWELADKYEYYDYTKGETPKVYMNKVRALSKEILEINKGNKEKSKADFDLFEFMNEEKAKSIFETVCKRYKRVDAK